MTDHSGVPELVAIVDEENRVVGSAPRPEMRARRLPHRATYILVFNSRGELYVQKRTATKDIYPSCYDPVAGGVVLAGESYEMCAERELEEELGIAGVPLTAHFDFYYEDNLVRVWGRAFSCRYDGPLELQAEEVEAVVTMTPEAVLADSPHRYTPDGLVALRRYLLLSL